MIFGPIYYISRSQYYHVAYKLTDSDILGDNLKVYPRFSYGRQDPRTFMAFMRIAAFILVIVALAINTFYLFVIVNSDLRDNSYSSAVHFLDPQSTTGLASPRPAAVNLEPSIP